DLIEANEAFAVQAIADGRALGWDWDRVNVNGGAIALGHPIGASGARILTTLFFALKDRKQTTGLATLCLGGGNAVALSVEMLCCRLRPPSCPLRLSPVGARSPSSPASPWSNSRR